MFNRRIAKMKIEDMTLKQKIGQMLMVGFPSKYFDEHVRKLVYEQNIGNIILFSRNVGDSHELATLTWDIQENMMKSVGVPAFIAIDQEGGMVTRIFSNATFLPGNMAIAATGESDNAGKVGMIMGKELKGLGINMNLAPVLDVNNNPLNPIIGVRSYGEVPKKVAELGLNYIEALQSQGVLATGKHFPGHGDTEVDSHIDLPSISHPMDRLRDVELYPFKKAIDGGMDAIMTAHILFKALETEFPATLSYNVITKTLREELGFEGIVITDCMEMKAISTYFGTPKAAIAAIKAGADIILVSHTLKAQVATVNAIENAVQKGDISMDRIDESVKRILSMKEKYCVLDDMAGTLGEKVSQEHRVVAKDISLDSITLVKDERELLPVESNDIIAISPNPVTMTGVEDNASGTPSFAQVVTQRFGGIYSVMDVEPNESYIQAIVEKSKDKELIIVGTYNANLNTGQAKLVEELYSNNKDIVVVALRNPYDISQFKYISTYVCAYEYTPLSIRSVVEVLSGAKRPVGKLPVSLEME